MKHLLIIPGVGDDHPVYHKAARVFAMFGFKPQVHVFGWDSADTDSYQHRMKALNATVKGLTGKVYLLGVSAGGSAALNSFAMLPERITKTATLCSPLSSFSTRVNPLLEVSLRHTEEFLTNMPPSQKIRLLSVHALFDPVVPIRLSKPIGVKQLALPSVLHAVTIFLGLTIFAGRIAHFFKQR